MIEFNVKNRVTGKVQFTAQIDCVKETPNSIILGLAVMCGIINKADLRGADLRGADLSGADLSGADLSGADLSGVGLRGADLRGADLRGADLTGADLSGADLSGADLSGADLRGADLRGADLRGAGLTGAVLRDAALSDADLRDADLGGGVPKIKNIHQTVYESASKQGALDMDDWHCGAAHCRAGWVTTLAGEGGAALESEMSAGPAAALIYIASDPNLEKIPDFFCSNDAAMADMKRLADLEKAAQINPQTEQQT